MVHVVFTPSGLTAEVEEGTTVLDAARRLGVDLDSVCGGRGICGRCQITPSPGNFSKWGIISTDESLSQPASTELDYRGRRPLVVGRRLGCAAMLCADAVIDVPADSQVHRQVVRKSVDLTGVVVDPVFSLSFLQLLPNTEGVAATRVLSTALREQHGFTAAVAPHLLAGIVKMLDTAGGEVTVAHRIASGRADGLREITAIWQGFVDTAYGIAVDIGSTTIAGYLCDLYSGEVVTTAGRMNPQIRYGEDLMSRVSYVMMNPGGDVELTRAVRVALDELVGELVDGAGVTRRDVLDLVLVGNPVMHHLLMGFDPVPLGQSPFTLATSDAINASATDLDLDAPHASVYVGPCIAGHVGADTTAAMLAEGPHRGDEWQLLVDVGTNAEIVLGRRGETFAASSPTGPAFEGAQLTCGQRATAGAIERVRINPQTLEPRIRVIGVEPWSDEPGFAEGVAKTGVTGICGSGIIEAIAEMYLTEVCSADGVVDGSLVERTSRVIADGRTFTYVLWEDEDRRVVVTQTDIRAIQLGKAALRAGIDLLMEHAGVTSLTDIRLAGAFGAHINPLHALVLGLVPDCVLEGVRAVGNAAGAGAVRALLSGSLRQELEDAARAVTKIETATEPRFQGLFVGAMAFPHATASAPHLESVVTLPLAKSTVGAESGRRRRSNRANDRMV
jgi:uncharacterized 2Fe-2S/4Fe-4S cluster protein (DUF4445 family)